MKPVATLAVLLSLAAAALSACGGDSDKLTIYSGRSETLIGPLVRQFTDATGVETEVLYGGTSEVAATILEEGSNSPADVFLAQDAGALGVLSDEGRLTALPTSLLDAVPDSFRSPAGLWVGVSGRARVIAYNTSAVQPDELPDSILDFTDPAWDGRIGWAPTNGSFQAFVTALRLIEGEETARSWLEDIKDNGARDYQNNTAILAALGEGEIEVGFTNHYYLYRFLAEEGEGFGARNYYLGSGDAGALVNIAGAAIVDTSNNREKAERFIEYLLSPEAQQYFSDETFEYPLVDGISAHPDLEPLSELDPPNIDLGDISDLRGTLDLLNETGVLP